MCDYHVALEPPNMGRRSRFAIWVGVCIWILCTPAWLGARPWEPPVAAGWATIGLAAMSWLLTTTPPDAIRLRPSVSVCIISAGALWLALASDGWTVGWWLAAVAIACGITAAAGLAGRRDTGPPPPWSAALILWHPLIPLGTRLLDDPAARITMMPAGALLLLALAIHLARTVLPGRWVPRWAAPAGAAAWMVAALATVVGASLAAGT